MGKVRKRRLSWNPSDSHQVVGYKLYWSFGNQLSYNSDYIELGRVTEVILPDVFGDNPPMESIILGITAVDNTGNESDITKIAEPFQHMVPPAPQALVLTPIDEFTIITSAQKAVNRIHKESELYVPRLNEEEETSEADSMLKFKKMLDKLKYNNVDHIDHQSGEALLTAPSLKE